MPGFLDLPLPQITGYAAVILGMILALPTAGLAQTGAGSFPDIPLSKTLCLLPLELARPSEPGGQLPWREPRIQDWDRTRLVPGIPFQDAPLKTDWVFDSKGDLAPFSGPFPNEELVQQALQEKSEQVVGSDSLRLYVLDIGTSTFRVVVPATFTPGWKFPERSLSRISYIPRIDQLFVTKSPNLMILKGEMLQPWLPAEDARSKGITKLRAPYDLPIFGALLFEYGKNGMALRMDDGRWFPLAELWRPERDFDWTVFELPKLNRVVVLTPFEIFAIDMPRDSRDAPRAESLLRHDGHLGGRAGLFSRSTGEYLYFKPPKTFLWFTLEDERLIRLTATGNEQIPGPSIASDSSHDPEFFDLSAIKRVLIGGPSNLYLYDGTKIQIIDVSIDPKIVVYHSVVNLPSIHRVIIDSFNDLFELDSEGVLRKLSLPLRLENIRGWRFTDVPDLGLVLVVARDGVFSLDAAWHVERLPSPPLPGFSGLGAVEGRIPGKKEYLVTTAAGSYRVVDRRDGANSPCDVLN